MGPLPYPHRATFLASTLTVPVEQDALVPYLARLISVIVFDQLVRHPVVTLGDHDDERLTDDTSRLLDVQHPQLEDSLDWLFRVSRRHEVLWFELSFDPASPRAAILRSRLPHGLIDQWGASPDLVLSQQLGQCLTQWLAARRLPAIAPLPSFTLEDLRTVADRLMRADELLFQGRELGIVPRSLTQPPQRLPVPFFRVLAELSRDDARTLDPIILELDPTHPVARRNHYVAGLVNGDTDRREILPLIAEAPMYAKPHLSVWGEPFAADRPLENMGVRHQGIASSLMPANPYACHNYSLQLAENDRPEESYRWADRATVAAPQFGAAHLDCVRRLRQVGRPGQAFAEAQYRYREIQDRSAAGKLSATDWQAPHHAALLIAFIHLDVGRLAEAIELADKEMSQVPDDPATRDAFAWAEKRIAHWKADPGLFARAYAWEGHHRGDVGRVLAGLMRGGLTDDEDAMMLIEALCTIGRADQAAVAYWQCAGHGGTGILGDGKARLAAAKALIVTGDLDEALDQIQIVQLRRSQSRLEAEINRLLRLAAIHPASDWEHVIERRLERGATTLARMAARDLCDFVPGLDTPVIQRALGERPKLSIDPVWIAELIAAVPAAQPTSSRIIARLAPPEHATLAAADALAQDWWTVLVPATQSRDAHAAGTLLALGLALANYLVAASGPPSPLAGAYRHIATEALHLVRRARYQFEPVAITALLRLIDRLGDTPEWLLDTWLLRIERALDLEAEHGAYLDGMIAGMPNVSRLLRGDERIGWELRLAHDLASDPSQYEPAAMLFTRAARAVEAGGVWVAWSAAATTAQHPTARDIQWSAALANPTGVADPWLGLARSLFAAGQHADGFAAACRGMAATSAKDRAHVLAELAPAWQAAGIATPLDGTIAFELGITTASEDRLEVAAQHLRWATAVEPTNPKRAHSLAVVLARLGRAHEAIRVLSHHERSDAPRLIGRVLVDCGHDAAAVAIRHYAARRVRGAEDRARVSSELSGEHSSEPSGDLSGEQRACDELEAGKFDSRVTEVASASWGVARVALAACELRSDDESGIPVSSRALDAAIQILQRSAGATQPEAVLARIRALRIRDNAFIQIDPPPPLGTRYSPEEFERTYAERDRRPKRPSTISVPRKGAL